MSVESDLADALLEMDVGPETVYYTPSGGTERAITAHVFRREGVDQESIRGAQVQRRRIEVYAKRDATTGVTTVTPNTDKVRLAERVGDTTLKSFLVREVIKQDSGSLTLLLGS